MDRWRMWVVLVSHAAPLLTQFPSPQQARYWLLMLTSASFS